MGSIRFQVRLLAEDGAVLKEFERVFAPKAIDKRFSVEGNSPMDLFEKVKEALAAAREKQNGLNLACAVADRLAASAIEGERYKIWCALGKNPDEYAAWTKENPIPIIDEASLEKTDLPVLQRVGPPIAGVELVDPPKKRRGRPAKIKTEETPSEDPVPAEATPQAEPIKKRRGRPPKNPVPQTEPAAEPVKKRRGRPPKNPVPEAAAEEPVKKKRGRPRKNPLPEGQAEPAKRGPGRPRKNPLPATEEPVKRKRGRPRKNPV